MSLTRSRTGLDPDGVKIFSTGFGSVAVAHYTVERYSTENPSHMETPITFIPNSEREALQWLIPALDRPLEDMPHDQFLKAWFSIGYLYGGLNPDEATFHGTEVSYEDNGPDRFRLIEPRLIAPFYVRSGWPVVLAPLAAEAWRRDELGMLADDELYCYELVKVGILDRMTGQTGLLSTSLIS